MCNYLVLINEMFPYGNDEPFLETEINYYNKFNAVYIFPCSKANSNNFRDIRNENIRVFTQSNSPKETFSKLKKVLRYVFVLFNPLFKDELNRLVKNRRFNFSTLKLLLSFISVAEYKLKLISKWLVKNDVKKDNNIIFYSYWMHFHAYIAIKLKRKYPNSKAVSRCHRFDLYEYINKSDYIPLREFIITNLDTIFCISTDGQKYIEDKYKGLKKNLYLSRLGTADKGIHNVSITKKPLKIISCSWMLQVKRIDRIIDVISRLGNFDIQWTHIGNGELFDKIEKYAEEKINGKVQYDFRGALSNSNILDLYKNEDFHVFINVSESEGIPVSIMEAMSVGMPVIATDVGGVNEIVINNFNGFLLDKDFTNSDLENYILRIYNMDEENYQKLRVNARCFWEQNYSQDKNYQQFVNLISSI